MVEELAAQDLIVRPGIGGRCTCQPGGAREPRLERVGDGGRDLALHGEHIVELALVDRGPEMRAARGLDELRGDPHSAPFPAYAALQQVAHAERARDRCDVRIAVPERERGGTRNHAQLRALRQQVQHFLRQPVGKVRAVACRAQVDERQHGDRSGACVCRRAVRPAAPVHRQPRRDQSQRHCDGSERFHPPPAGLEDDDDRGRECRSRRARLVPDASIADIGYRAVLPQLSRSDRRTIRRRDVGMPG